MPAPIHIIRTLFVALFLLGLILPVLLTDHRREPPPNADLPVAITQKVPFTPAWMRTLVERGDEARRRFSLTFWGRDTLLQWVGNLKLHGFRTARWNPQTLRGKEGWLFLQTEQVDDTVAIWRGAITLKPGEVEKITRSLVAWRDWLALRGIDFLILLAPNKLTIHSEFAPDWLKQAEDGMAATLVASWREAGLDVIDLTPALKEAAQDGPLYHRTDTHWNARGAYTGYLALMRHPWFSSRGLDPLGEEAFQRISKLSPGGDLAHPLRENPALMETIESFRARHPTSADYEGRLHQREGLTRFTNPEINGPRLFTVNDSFMHAVANFLQSHTSELQMWWMTRYIFPAEAIESAAPDLVVFEVVERFLPLLIHLSPPQADDTQP